MNGNRRSHRMRQWLALALVLTMIFGQMAIAMAESFDPYGEEVTTPTNSSTSGTIIPDENGGDTTTTANNGAQVIGGSFNPYGEEGGEYSLEGEQGITGAEGELGLEGEGDGPQLAPFGLEPIQGTPDGIDAKIAIDSESTDPAGHNQKITIIGSIKDKGKDGSPAITAGMKMHIVFPSYLKLLSDSGLDGWLDTLKDRGVITQSSGMLPAPYNNVCELEFTGQSADGFMLELEFQIILTVDATVGGNGESVQLVFIERDIQYVIETDGIDIDDGSLTQLGVTKRFWGDNVQNLGNGLYKIIDKTKPVQYMVNLKLPDVDSGTFKITDIMSDSLTLCDANGNPVTQANVKSAIVFVTPFTSDYEVTLTSNGFEIDVETPFTGGDYRFYYYVKLGGGSTTSVLENQISVDIEGLATFYDNAELLSGDATVRFVGKKLLVGGNYVDEAALIEGENGVFEDLTFYIVISQYQDSFFTIPANEFIVEDELQSYFTFKSFGDVSSTPFVATHENGVINVYKNNTTEKIKSGKYYIPVTVSVNPSYIAEGMSGFNKVMDSTVHVYRNAKLIINKNWAQGEGNPQRGTNVTFRLVNDYSGATVAEKTVPTTQTQIVLFINYLNANLRDGTNTYTLKEIVANDSDYSNLPNQSITITKDTTARRVIVGDLGEPNVSGRKVINLENVPDDFFGEITFVKHKLGEVNTKLTGGRYKLYMVSDRHGKAVDKYVDFSGPVANAYTYTGTSAGGTEFTMLALAGTLLKALPYGQYKLYELEAPAGYITPANNDPNISVTLSKTNKYANTNVPNGFYSGGKAAVYKYNGNESARTPMNGVSFTLQRLEGNWTTVQTKTTNSSGLVEFTGLSEGKYRLREQIPFGYVGYSSSGGYRDVEFEIKQGVTQLSPLVVFYDSVNNPTMNIGQTVNMDWYNTMLYGSLEVTKTGNSSVPLQGVKFELYSGTSHADPSKKVKFTVSGSNYTYATSGTVTELTTDSNGKFNVLDLPYGTYTLLETATITGYVLPSTPYSSITINKDITTQSINNSARLGEVHIQKRGQVEGTTYNNLQGVDFALKTLGGATVKSGTTDINGKIDWTGIQEGTYYLHETATVPGFKLITAVTEVVIGGGDASTYWIKNLSIDNDRILQNIKVVKKDENGNALAGAKFRLSGTDFSNRSFLQEQTTNSSGEAMFTNVPFSSSAGYTLSEIEAPQGYSIVEDQTIMFTSPRETPLVITINDLPFKLRVIKTGDNGNTYLAGAKFVIKAPSGQFVTATSTGTGTYKYTGTVAAQTGATEFVTVGTGGQFEITHMPKGLNYSIIETEAPQGYNKLTTPTLFTISDDLVDATTKVYTATISNTNIVGGIRILKLNEKSSFMEGIEFTINGPSGTQTKATDSNGEVVFDNLLYGTYTITEADPGNLYPGYDMSYTTTVNVHTNGQVEFLSVVNTKLTGKVTIFKSDHKNVGLKGAQFVLYPVDVNGNIVKTGYKQIEISGTNGVVEFAGLPYGIYAIEELDAPPGYVKSTDIRYVNIGNATVPDGITISPSNDFDWQNAQIKGSLKLYKSDGTNFLVGAKFELTDADGNPVKLSGTAGQYVYDEAGTVTEFTTDAGGYALIEQLPYGAYILTETEEPQGFTLDQTPYNFFITANGVEIQHEHVNRAVLGTLRIYKHDSANNTIGLLGSVVRIYNKKAGVQTPTLYENTQAIEEATTGAAGFVYVKDLPFGDYVAIEVQPPVGYHLGDDTLKEFTIDSTNVNVVQDVVFSNDKVDYKLIIYKVDADNNLVKLQGAKFKVINTDTNWGPDPDTLVTDVNGEIELTGLGAGTYEITELEAPAGYVKDNNTFTIKFDGTGGDEDSDGKVEVTAKNELILGKVELLKLDENEDQLDGATFRLQDKAGNIIKLKSLGADEYEYDTNGSVTEFEAGKITIDKLPEGEYVFFEVSPPTGYVKLGEKYAFSVTGANFKSLIEVEAQNLPIKSTLAVRKVDESNESLSLAGAEFELLSSTDNGATYTSTGITKTTNTAGYVYFTDLMPGYYRISEKTAPAGYIKWTGSINFRVQNDGSITMGANNTALTEENGVFMASISNRKIEHEFVVRKQDSNTGSLLSGAVFSLTSGSVSHTLVTGTNGLTTAVKLPVGTYTLTEVSAPSGYMLSNKTYSVVVSDTGITVDGSTVSSTAPYTLTINNTPVTTNVVLYKTNSSTNASLSGAAFSVTKRNSTTAYSLYSGPNGLSNTITLTPGIYDIVETTTPTGFTRPLSGWTITVSNDGVVSATGSGINVYSNYGAVVVNISNTPTSTTTTPTPTPTTSGGGGGGGGGGTTIPLNSGSESSDDPIPLGPGLPQTGQATRSGEMLIASLAILISLVALMVFVVQDKQLAGDNKRQLLPSLV